MKKKSIFILTFIFVFLFSSITYATDLDTIVENYIGQGEVTEIHMLGAKASKLAMEKLNFTKNSPDVLCMTNASFAIINGHTTEKALDGITAVTGCTVGKSNLLMVQRSKDKPLCLLFIIKQPETQFI